MFPTEEMDWRHFASWYSLYLKGDREAAEKVERTMQIVLCAGLHPVTAQVVAS